MGTQAGIDVYIDGTGAVQGARTVTRSFDDIISSASNVSMSVKDITSALMGVAGNVAGIYGIAQAIRKLGEYAQDSLKYLALIETSTLGIAAAYMSSGDYIDKTTGRALKGSEALRAAQAESAKTIDQLRVANMQTIATLDQLIVAYQTTLPVAMAKGFNKQQVMDYTLAMTQAAAAVGLPMNQLPEETRSLLMGTISNRNTRIATSILGMSTKDNSIIRELGDLDKATEGSHKLFDFLMEKLEAVKIAGLESQKTWNGLWSNIKDIAQMGSGVMFEPMFDQIKKILTDVMHGIVSIDTETKMIKWNPEFLEFATSASEFLRKSWIGISGLVETIYDIFVLFEPILTPIVKLIGMALDGLGMISAAILPVLMEELISVKDLVGSSAYLAIDFGLAMMDAVGMVGSALISVGKAALQALTGDFDAAGETLKNMFSGTFADRFSNQVKKIGKDVTDVTDAWKSMDNPMGRMLDRADAYMYKKNKLKPTDDSDYKSHKSQGEVDELKLDEAAYARELEKWRASDRAILNAYNKDVHVDVKAAAEIQLATQKNLHDQGLILTEQFLASQHRIKVDAFNRDITQLENSAITAQESYEKAMSTAPNKPADGADSDVVNVYNTAMMTVKRTKKEMIEAWTKVYEVEGKAAVETEVYTGAVVKNYNSQFLAIEKVKVEINSLLSANEILKASLDGTNSRGGFDTLADQMLNEYSKLDAAHKNEIRLLEEQKLQAVQTWMMNEKSVANNVRVLGVVGAATEKQHLIELKYAQDRSKIVFDKTAEGGMINAIQNYGKETENIGKQVENIWTNVFKNIEDSIVRAFETSEFAAEDMIKAIAADVVRMQIAKPITNMIAGAFTPATEAVAATATTAAVPATAGGALAGVAPYLAVAAVGYTIVDSFQASDAARKKEHDEAIEMQETINESILSTKQGLTGEVFASEMTALLSTQQQTRSDVYGVLTDASKFGDLIASYFVAGKYSETDYWADSGENSNWQDSGADGNAYLAQMDTPESVIPLSDTWQDLLEVQELERQQLFDKQMLTNNNLRLTELELQGLEDTTYYTKILGQVREGELYGLDLTAQAIQRRIWVLEDEQDALEKVSAAITDTIDIALSAANAIKTIQGGSLSTDSPEEKYRKAILAFTSNTDNSKAGELGQEALAASQSYNASGAGYQADYLTVMDKLKELAGLTGTTTVDPQITLLTAIRDAIVDGTNPILSDLDIGSTITNITDAYNTNTSNTDLSSTLTTYNNYTLADARDVLNQAAGLTPQTTSGDVNGDGLVNTGDAMLATRLAAGVISQQDIWDIRMSNGIAYPGYASGGYHQGGFRIVGENGPELEATGPSRIFNANQTRDIFANGSADNKETVAELKEQNRLLRELLVESKANLRVNQAGFTRVIEQGEESNQNGRVLSRGIRLQAAA